ncbi:MAG: hypothetical protein MST07_00640 [Firmicutes bacterium]|nr:hypothetical protein [Bacillota bacterium]
MIKDIEELKNEIETFQTNMNQTNGIIDKINSEIALIEQNYNKLESIAQSMIDTNNEFKKYGEAINKAQENTVVKVETVQKKQANIIEELGIMREKQDILAETVHAISTAQQQNKEEMIMATNRVKSIQIVTIVCVGITAILSVIMHII